jgi:competence protein ComEA
MLWLYRLQQRLTITPAEGTALLVASGALVAGLAVRQIQASSAPPLDNLLAQDDSLAAIDRALAEQRAGLLRTAGGPVPLPADSGVVVATLPATPDEAERPARRSRAGPPAPHSVSINTASVAELDRLPRIGPALAARIVEHRARHGPFARVEDLEAVRGIGPRMLEQILPYARL